MVFTKTREEDDMARKTKKMIAVEERFHQPLEKMLPEMVTDQGCPLPPSSSA